MRNRHAPGWWGGGRAQAASEYCKRVYGWTCWICHHEIVDDYTVDHIKDRFTHPELTWEPSNWRPAHGRKHPEFRCPGNYGRRGGGLTEAPNWTALGW